MYFFYKSGFGIKYCNRFIYHKIQTNKQTNKRGLYHIVPNYFCKSRRQKILPYYYSIISMVEHALQRFLHRFLSDRLKPSYIYIFLFLDRRIGRDITNIHITFLNDHNPAKTVPNYYKVESSTPSRCFW